MLRNALTFCLLLAVTLQAQVPLFPYGSAPLISKLISEQTKNKPKKYTVAHTSDLHLWYFGSPWGEVTLDREFDRFALLDSISPLALVLNSGDNAGGGGVTQAVINRFEEIRDDPTRAFAMPPWISAMGNHEIDGHPVIGKSDWLKMLNPGVDHTIPYPGNFNEVYFATIVGRFVYVTLDQNALGCGGYCLNAEASQMQLNWLQAVFAHPSTQNKIGVIVLHEPLLGQTGNPIRPVAYYNGNSETTLNVFRSIPQIKIVFSGHVHTQVLFKSLGITWVLGYANGQTNYFLDIDESNYYNPWKVGIINNLGNVLYPTITDHGYTRPL